MRKSKAEDIMNATLSLNEELGRIDRVISDMSDGNEKKAWVRKLG